MEVPLDYHLLFIVFTIVMFLVTIILLFFDPKVEQATAGTILIMLNMIFCIVVALSFQGLDYYGFDYNGNVVHNVYTELWPFHVIWLGLFYVNLMLLVYCAYLFWKKPWDEYVEQEKYYQNTSYEY